MVTLRGLRERGELGQLCVSELGAGHEAGVAAPDEGHHQVRELLSGCKYFLNFPPEGPCIHNTRALLLRSCRPVSRGGEMSTQEGFGELSTRRLQ